MDGLVSSGRQLYLAVLMAFSLHALLLFTNLPLTQSDKSNSNQLTVTLGKPEPKEEKATEQVSDIVNIQPPKEKKQLSADDLGHLLNKLSTEFLPENPAPIVSPQSNFFKEWLQSETERYQASKPESLSSFRDSFDERSKVNKSEPALSPYMGNPGAGGSTAFMTEHKGKRTCLVKIINMLDISSKPSFLGKDCTPKEQFVLNLNKPNNGWMER